MTNIYISFGLAALYSLKKHDFVKSRICPRRSDMDLLLSCMDNPLRRKSLCMHASQPICGLCLCFSCTTTARFQRLRFDRCTGEHGGRHRLTSPLIQRNLIANTWIKIDTDTHTRLSFADGWPWGRVKDAGQNDNGGNIYISFGLAAPS